MRRAALLTAVLSLAILGSPVASAGADVTPTLGQVVPHGTMVSGSCTLTEGVESGRKTSWEIDGVIPAFLHGGSGGVQLAPRAEDTPRLAHTPTDVFGSSWVVVPNLLAAPQRPGGNCVIQSFDPLQAKTMEEAGPHVFTQYDEQVHFVFVPDGSDDPVPQPCPLNDLDFPSPGDVQPPDAPVNGHWAPDTFCNATQIIGFYVTAASDCPISGDMTQWPTSPYISQYDAGARLNLPLGSGRKGGNACGPSSLLMAMLSGGATGLPPLPDVFDATMRLDRVQVQPGGNNVFEGNPKGVALAKSLGFRQARVLPLPRDVQGIETQILTSLHKGANGGPSPVVISTAFGGARWGVTGGGHMIAIVGADGRGGFIVEDPAGNYFSTPKAGYSDTSGGHYGPGSCGHRAVYPHFWLLAYVTGRWLLELGPRTTPPPPPRAVHAAAEASLGSALSVADANAGGADAPTSFYLQDASGKRAGWIDGQPVEEIPDSAVGQDPPGWTDPAIGDDSIVPDQGNPPPTPRSVVINGPATGVTLHVVQTAGAQFALRVANWDSGKLVSGDTVTGTGTGADAVAGLPAPGSAAAAAKLTASKAKVRKRVVSVPLACSAPAGSSCRYAIALTAKKGRRTVTIAKRAGTVGGGKKLTVKLRPSATGRKFLKGKRRVATTLVVKQVNTAAAAAVVRRQKLKL